MARRKSKSDSAISESEQIDLFLARGQELWNTRARRLGFNLSFSIKGDIDTKEITTKIEEPDIEDVRSFLTIFYRNNKNNRKPCPEYNSFKEQRVP